MGATYENGVDWMNITAKRRVLALALSLMLLISAFGDTYVLVAFGVNDAMNPFVQHFNAVYPGFETLVDEAIA